MDPADIQTTKANISISKRKRGTGFENVDERFQVRKRLVSDNSLTSGALTFYKKYIKVMVPSLDGQRESGGSDACLKVRSPSVVGDVTWRAPTYRSFCFAAVGVEGDAFGAGSSDGGLKRSHVMGIMDQSPRAIMGRCFGTYDTFTGLVRTDDPWLGRR